MDADTDFQLFELDDDSEDDVCDESDVGWLQRLEEIEKEAKEIREILKEGIPFVERIKSRLPRHLTALEELAQWCREEIDHFGLWREDEADFEEIYDAICEEADSIVHELKNDHAMSFALDDFELAECRELASTLLESAKYLSGAELEFLDEVVSAELFDTRRLLEIAGNNGQSFRLYANLASRKPPFLSSQNCSLSGFEVNK